MVNTSGVTNKPITKTQDKVLLKIERVSKIFDDVRAVDDVSLTINRGEIFALLGGSGSGKSTLLRMLAGFEKPSEGRIFLDGVDITDMPPYERPINMMFQSYALFPHMTVEQNIAFGLKQDKMPKADIAVRVKEMLKLVHMEKYGKRKPHQLSGGQRQRVALARSLAKRPKLLLLDEPMGALDKKLRTQMQLEVVDILEAVGVTCVMVTHDQEEAMTMAGRISIMHEGWIAQTGSPMDIYESPASRMVAEFIGTVNLFDGEIIEDEVDHAIIKSPTLSQLFYIGHGISTSLENKHVFLALRPEKTIISRQKPESDYNWAHGVVHDIAYLGGLSVYYIKLKNNQIVQCSMINRERRADHPTWEEEVYISWEDTSGVVLNS
ncbi:polyamine ABC transporter ATP-binding protein [Shewanella sp. SR43-4]|jgi:putrescine transport system ATP-binding protein|uniref:Spermidine/putrescine import ATP-binding protein PotA n=1 Tax=Shewanella vesiculosa TaxID=518738 RepID=A0ABV0FRN1_9GAMM|nr:MULTISPECIES: polyamine ABC transporter ATP-binding protein [Shewanella]NCQ44715.1 polyamine ABC transporter ATP-binding protein [Shewanella frigidimarina]MBB1319736.1 polyamine ABC transporter ATP-binding protein [Shewanella sp. SR43-4]MBB1321243.1 polyamine ABC transporter ATP-binding protein [Shewanella sp. SR43-8]MBB1390685.1 polyamine ABC transporter ATP-binding protein [Shewanella sp. SG44-6]MBB1474164.1 polyamine ABC transporter ATP-binding protein [Shewanella sp. SG41-3]|tara:strand:- start:239 stop:1375 length:1137 start_codon:yes stop_codon:yes gene_type:complete